MLNGAEIVRRQGGATAAEKFHPQAAAVGQFGEHPLDHALVGLKAQPVGGGIFQVVGLVYNQIVVRWQYLVTGDNVREQESVIDDDNVRRLGRLPGQIQWDSPRQSWRRNRP